MFLMDNCYNAIYWSSTADFLRNHKVCVGKESRPTYHLVALVLLLSLCFSLSFRRASTKILHEIHAFPLLRMGKHMHNVLIVRHSALLLNSNSSVYVCSGNNVHNLHFFLQESGI